MNHALVGLAFDEVNDDVSVLFGEFVAVMGFEHIFKLLDSEVEVGGIEAGEGFGDLFDAFSNDSVVAGQLGLPEGKGLVD